MNKIKHFFGFHDYIECQPTGNEKFEYQGLFDLFITRYCEYKCIVCNRKFYMPPGSFLEFQSQEISYKLTKTAAEKLAEEGKYNEAIKILKGE